MLVRKYLFNTVAGLSLLLLAATFVLWVRSYWSCDVVSYATTDGRRMYVAACSMGEFRCGLLKGFFGLRFRGLQVQTDPPELLSQALRPFGFDGTREATSVVLPAWFWAMTLAMLPTIWWRSWYLTRRKRQLGCCPTCGYDLRATPDRCPECGTLVNVSETTEVSTERESG